MRFLFGAFFVCLVCLPVLGQSTGEWPVLVHYDQNHVERIAMPIGGIGTGTVSLTGRGGLRDWEIMNRPAKGYNPWFGPETSHRSPFFVLNIQKKDGSSIARLLEGPPKAFDYEGSEGSVMENHGLPRFRESTFDAAYPFGQSHLSDPDVPVDVTVRGFNPLIPGNVDDSSIPVAVLTYRVKNKTNQALEISIAGTIQNFIGYDGAEGEPDNNKNEYRENENFRGIYFTSNGVDPESEQWGTMSLISLADGETTYRTKWKPRQWGSSSLDFWDDFTEDGLLENCSNPIANAPIASIAIKSELKPSETKDFRFLITWHFPNRRAWATSTIGNYYTEQYEDAWDVAEKVVPRLRELEKNTLEFVNAFLGSDLPKPVKEAALFNVANLRSQTVFRSKQGYLFGWEGNFSHEGACFGSCTHVWNYEQTTPFLFGELAKTMREVEFNYATDEQGLMSFRVHLPLDSAQVWGKAAADGQMGTIMKLYREWQLSGDDGLLIRLWPNAKKALQFAWIKGGWDEDKDGVMEGAQHNTMDVEYYGPNPQMSFWYLGALRASEKMANYLGEEDFADTCHRLYEHGSAWIDENLFNGEYYEQIIQPPMEEENVAAPLLIGMGAKDLSNPDYQLGKGVLVDQLIGQLMAHILDLGYLANKEHIQTTLKSIMKYNYKEDFLDHVNFMRSFVLDGESGLLMASYPHERPKNPFPYFTEVMTGFEYTAAIGMLYEGQLDNGLKVIKSIRNRYDGRKRSPFNEAEYGNHYARAMIAWAAVNALTGFHYSAVNKSMSFNPKEGDYFWSNGYGYGTVKIENQSEGKRITLTSINEDFELNSFELNGFGCTEFGTARKVEKGELIEFVVEKSGPGGT